jgi:hypothetical protein
MKLLCFAPALLAVALPWHGRAQVEVEPGVRLISMVSAVEQTADGPRVTAIKPAAILSNAHTGSNMARGLVYSGQHNTVETAGVTSNTSFLPSPTAFYIHIDTDDPNDPSSELTLIRLKPEKDTRLVLNLTANTFGGGRKRKLDEIAVTKTLVAGTWLKVTPQAPLPPGEYGFMILPKDVNLFADRVYDFTIAPK